MDILTGTIERITYQSEETGYTVARLRAEPDACRTTENLARAATRDGLLTVTGELAKIAPGERVEVSGFWVTHKQYGKQFKIVESKSIQPTTTDGIRKYLGSGLIKGLGPAKAAMIVDHFGEDTLAVIENTPGRLSEVKGIAKKTIDVIRSSWEEQKHIQEVMQFLLGHDVSMAYAVKIYKAYGNEAIRQVTENPYRLSTDIWGIGFKTADKIAMNLGVDPGAPARVEAGIRYVLEAQADDGHVFVPLETLTEESAAVLEVDAEAIPAGIGALVRAEVVLRNEDRVYLQPLYYAEQGIARHIARLVDHPRTPPPPERIDEHILHIERERGIVFNAEQREAIHTSASRSVLAVTGGPGTGKTTCVQGIVYLFNRVGAKVLLAAPTGRAAKRLSEVTGAEAKTIHRLLEFNPGLMEFGRDQDNRLEADLVILDESSMVDTVLMNAVLRAVKTSARFIMVGDVDQLPSVGAGNVLRDMIDAGRLPVVRLTEIFRQARESSIVMNAHRVNRGEMPDTKNRNQGDFFFINEPDPSAGAEQITELLTDRLPRKYGLDPFNDIQVLTPMYRGDIGVDQLNQKLQQVLNPSGASLKRGDRELRVGDKVLQTRNNYGKMTFNGDIGRITHIDPDDQAVDISFQESVRYDYGELDELVLAYAISVHKSQGSEYPAIILPLYSTHYIMLQRNLLYTALTRARALAVLVGTPKALAIAVKNNRVVERYTGLRDALGELIGDRTGSLPGFQGLSP
ncbi:MAG: ATP-dependent RecD-like DNA helicase [Gemmatimonadetes bacterium]|nr:ATP-dependent RecD-like DNA helicase [Gemmatimonadota bacterium]MYG86023.1 ATP-dependent RecD-like DNA helicase [Gemmatimonadota bacterium]MYJ89112.1 ATP-dependent RecD-like DNA helicase [Gemmatimonadota bacterium]